MSFSGRSEVTDDSDNEEYVHRRHIPVSRDVLHGNIFKYLTPKEVAHTFRVSKEYSKQIPDSYWLKKFRENHPDEKLLGDEKMPIIQRVSLTEEIIALKKEGKIYDVLDALIRNGDLTKFKLIYDPKEYGHMLGLFQAEAALANQVEMYKYLRSLGNRLLSRFLLYRAVDSGSFDIVKYIVENEDPDLILLNSDINRAREKGFNDIADYLESIG